MRPAALHLVLAILLALPAGSPALAQATRVDAEKELKQGQAAARKGEYARAAAAYARAIEAVPGHVDATVEMAWVEYKLGRFRSAALYSTQVLECDPNHPRAAAVLGLALLRSGFLGRAYGVLVETLRHDPDTALAIAGLAELRMYANDFVGGLRLARRAVILAPREPDFAYLHGQAAARQEEFEEAALAFERFLEIAPKLDRERREKIQGLIALYHRLDNIRLYNVKGPRTADISFTLTDRTIPVLKVRVNGRPPMNFVLDTGSGFTVISEETAAKLRVRRLASGGVTQGVGGGGKFPIVYGLINEIDLGPLKIQNVPTYIRKFHYPPDAKVDGFIGLSLLSRFRIALDYQARRLELRPPNSPLPPLAPTDLEIPYRVTSGGMLSIPAGIGGGANEHNLIVDTGASSTVLADVVLESLQEGVALSTRAEASVVGAAGVTDRVPIVVLEKLSVFSLEQRYVRALVLNLDTLNESAGFRQSGILGGNFLRHYRIGIDFVRGVITLHPYPEQAGRVPGDPGYRRYS